MAQAMIRVTLASGDDLFIAVAHVVFVKDLETGALIGTDDGKEYELVAGADAYNISRSMWGT